MIIYILAGWIFLVHVVGAFLYSVIIEDYFKSGFTELLKLPLVLRMFVLLAWPYLMIASAIYFRLKSWRGEV